MSEFIGRQGGWIGLLGDSLVGVFLLGTVGFVLGFLEGSSFAHKPGPTVVARRAGAAQRAA